MHPADQSMFLCAHRNYWSLKGHNESSLLSLSLSLPTTVRRHPVGVLLGRSVGRSDAAGIFKVVRTMMIPSSSSSSSVGCRRSVDRRTYVAVSLLLSPPLFPSLSPSLSVPILSPFSNCTLGRRKKRLLHDGAHGLPSRLSLLRTRSAPSYERESRVVSPAISRSGVSPAAVS